MVSTPATTDTDDAGAGEALSLGQRFKILPGQFLPHLSLPGVPAYVAEDARAPGAALYALVGNPSLPARIETMTALKGARANGLVSLIEFGPIAWPAGKDCRIAAIFETPEGGPVVPRNEPFTPIPGHLIADAVLRPLVSALDEISQRNLTHRAIRPNNLFFRDRERRRVVLGPGVAAPPAFYQPADIEPLESALCDPIGRGEGSRADDMFALGATMLALMWGNRPGPAGDSFEFMTERFEQGSYAALLSNLDVPQALAECLRGLLTDLPSERWKLETVKAWLDGRRGPSPMGATVSRSDRPLNFGSREITNARSLALAMSKDAKNALGILQESKIERWLRNGLRDGKRADAFATFREGLQVASRHNNDAVPVARALMILDPEAPIRYRGIAIHPEGIGAVLAAGFDRPETIQTLGELLRLNLIGTWLNEQTRLPKSMAGSLAGQAQRLARWVGDSGFGRGIERCLYELNPDLPCRSPLVAKEWVAEPADLLAALDRTARDADHSSSSVDRHIAGFVLARAGVDADRLAALLASARNPGEIALGTAKLLAWMQKRYCVPPLPNLAAWVTHHLQSAVELFRHRPLRAMLKERLAELTPKGDLDVMMTVIDNDTLRRDDSLRFAQAAAEYGDLTKKIHELAHAPGTRQQRAVTLGHQIATLIAGAVCVVSVGAALMGMAP